MSRISRRFIAIALLACAVVFGIVLYDSVIIGPQQLAVAQERQARQQALNRRKEPKVARRSQEMGISRRHDN